MTVQPQTVQPQGVRPPATITSEAGEFRLLSDAAFERLSAEEKIAYLKRALEMRHAIDAQLDAWRYASIPAGKTFRQY